MAKKKQAQKRYHRKLTKQTFHESSLDHIEHLMTQGHKTTFRVINVIVITLLLSILLFTNVDNVNMFAFIILLGIFEYFMAYSMEKRYHKDSVCHHYFADTTHFFVISVGFYVVSIIFAKTFSGTAISVLNYGAIILGSFFGGIGFERMCHLGFSEK